MNDICKYVCTYEIRFFIFSNCNKQQHEEPLTLTPSNLNVALSISYELVFIKYDHYK